MSENVVLVTHGLHVLVKSKPIRHIFRLVLSADDILLISICNDADTLQHTVPYPQITRLLLSSDLKNVPQHIGKSAEAPAFLFTVMTDSETFHFIILNTQGDISFLVKVLQYSHSIPYASLPAALFEAALRNLSPGVTDIYYAQRIPTISLASARIYTNVIDVLEKHVVSIWSRESRGSCVSMLQDIINMSYWPAITIFISSCLILLATGPYSNQSYTIAHLLSMRTQSFNLLLSHVSEIVFGASSDTELGYVEVMQSACLYKGQSIVLYINVPYVAKYMLQFKDLSSRYTPAFRVPDFLSAPLFANNRVKVHDSTLFAAYKNETFAVLRSKPEEICAALAGTMPVCLAALEPLSIVVRSTILRAFAIVLDKLPSLCLTNVLYIMETIFSTLSIRYMKSMNYPTILYPKLISEDHEEGRISVVFTPGLYEGDITHLIISDEFSKALALQHILGALFLPSTWKEMPVYYQGAPLLPSVLKYINPDGTLSEAYRLDTADCSGDILDDVPLSPLVKGSILYFILRAVAEILMAPSPDVPNAIKAMLATATVSVRINYGQPSETASGQDNVLTEFVLSSDNSGGGDASLFLDAPGVLCPLLHFFVASQNTNEARGLFSVFEYWTRIGIKGYPPSVALVPEFFKQVAHGNLMHQAHNLLDDSNQAFCPSSSFPQADTYRYVPQASVILLDINVLPSSRQAFVNLGQDMTSNRTENERCIKEFYTRYSDTRREDSIEDLISISDMFYYFIQTQSIEEVLEQNTIQNPANLSPEATRVSLPPNQQDDYDMELRFRPILHRIPHELIHFTEAARYVTEIDIRTNMTALDTAGHHLSTGADIGTSISANTSVSAANDFLYSQSTQMSDVAKLEEKTLPPAIDPSATAVPAIAPQAFAVTSFSEILQIVTTAGLLRSILQYLTGFARYFLSVTFNSFFLKTQSLSIYPLMDIERTLRLAASIFSSNPPDSLLSDVSHTLSYDVLTLVQSYLASCDNKSGLISHRHSELFNGSKGCDPKPSLLRKRISSSCNFEADLALKTTTFVDTQYGIDDAPRFLQKPRLFIIPHYCIMLAIAKYVFEHQKSSDYIAEAALNTAVSECTHKEMRGYVERCSHSESATNKPARSFDRSLEGLFRTAYNCEIDAAVIHFFEYEFDANARLPGRRFISPDLIFSVQGVKVPWATLRSLYPELISIPDISLHVPNGKDDIDLLTLDLGFVPHHGRASLMAFYTSIIPRYFARLRNQYVNILIQPSVDSINQPFYPNGKGSAYKKNQVAKHYETGGLWLSSILHNIFGISRVLITAVAYDEPVVSIAPLDGGEKCLILRCIEVSLTHVDSGLLSNMSNVIHAKEDPLHGVHGTHNLPAAPLGVLVPEVSPVISELLTPGLVSEITSLMGDFNSPGLSQASRYTNPFHALFSFKILSVETLFGHICTKLKLHTILPTITFLRNVQYALLNRNSAEAEVDIPSVFVLNAHDALDLFSKLCMTILRAEFANIPGLTVSAKRHILRVINSCPFIIIGAESRTEVSVCAGKTINTNPASGRVCFSIGASNILAKREAYRRVLENTVRSKFIDLNPILAMKPLEHYSIALYVKITLDNNYAIGFCSIRDTTIDSMFVTDAPILMCIIIPSNFDCIDERLFNKSRCLINSPVFVASSPSFMENTSLCISISQDDIKKANESIAAEVLYPIAPEDPIVPQLGHVEGKVLASLAESMQALPARLQALRYSCGDIQKRLGGNINVSLLPMSFSFGTFSTQSFIRVASMLDFTESLAASLFSVNVLPLSINYVLYLKNKKKIQFHPKSDNTARNYIPLNLVLLGPDECTLPDSISPLVFVMRQLRVEPIEKIVQLLDKDVSGKALLSLVPILLVDKFSLQFSNDSPDTAEAIKKQAEIEQQDRTSEIGNLLVNALAIEEHARNTVNTVFNKSFGPTKVTSAAADELVHGPYLYLACDPTMWRRLYDAIQRSSVYSSTINMFLAKYSMCIRDKEAGSSIILLISLLIGARIRHDLTLGRDNLMDYVNWKMSCC